MMKGRFPMRDSNLKQLLTLGKKGAVIATHLASLEEKFEITSQRFNNLTKYGHKSLLKESLFSGNFAFIITT